MKCIESALITVMMIICPLTVSPGEMKCCFLIGKQGVPYSPTTPMTYIMVALSASDWFYKKYLHISIAKTGYHCVISDI